MHRAFDETGEDRECERVRALSGNHADDYT
jgi:hypothetical protein